MGSPDVRLDVQGLRAVGAVVADHAGVRHLAGGYVGVDVFLVVSGFLITSLLLREADRAGRISLRGFYARPAQRDGYRLVPELAPDVRMIGDVSMIGLEPADCLTARHATMASCTATEKKRTVVANRLGRRAANAAGVPFVPVAQLARQDGRCPAFAGARMVYADHSHLSIDWVEHVWHEFDRLVAEASATRPSARSPRAG